MWYLIISRCVNLLLKRFRFGYHYMHLNGSPLGPEVESPVHLSILPVSVLS